MFRSNEYVAHGGVAGFTHISRLKQKRAVNGYSKRPLDYKLFFPFQKNLYHYLLNKSLSHYLFSRNLYHG